MLQCEGVVYREGGNFKSSISSDKNLVTKSDYIGFSIHIGNSVYKCDPTP